MPDNGAKVNHSHDGFIIIPNPIMQSKALSLKAKVLFGVIWSLSHGTTGQCYASNAHLAFRAGMKADRRFVRIFAELETAGLIRRIISEQHHRDEIMVTWKGKPIVRPTGPEKPLTHGQNGHGSKRSVTPGQNVQGTPGQNVQGTPGQNVHQSITDEKTVEKTILPPSSSSPSPSQAQRAHATPSRRLTPAEREAERLRQHAALDARFPKQPDSNGKNSAPSA